MACSKLGSGFKKLEKQVVLSFRKFDINNLNEQLIKALTANAEILDQSNDIIATLTSVLRNIRYSDKNGRTRLKYPNAEILLFGSTKAHVGTSTSDIDLCILLRIGQEKESRQEKLRVLYDFETALKSRETADHLEGIRFKNIHVVPIDPHPKQQHKRRPPSILKMRTGDGLSVDVCVEDIEGPIFTEIVKIVKSRGGRIMHAMIVALKIIGNMFNVLDTQHQFPSATNLFFIVLYFFQSREDPVLGPLNVMAMNRDQWPVPLAKKLLAKGDWGYLIEKYQAQAAFMGWTKEANAALNPRLDSQGNKPALLKRYVDLDKAVDGESMEDRLKSLLVEFGEWIGNPDKLPSVIDVGNPKRRLMPNEISRYGSPVQVLCGPIQYYCLRGDTLAEFRLVYKTVAERLQKTEIMLQIGPKTGNRKPERRERLQKEKLRLGAIGEGGQREETPGPSHEG